MKQIGFPYSFLKRSMDITVSFFGLILLSPVLLLIAILVRFNLGSPVLFRQERPGWKEKYFVLYKFRTMKDLTAADGKVLPDRERLTRLGSFLRSTSLDELPELWNILKGEMSLVGPRPLLIEYLPFYSEREQLRSVVRPGLTGLAQVSGRNFIGWNERLEWDVKYVENCGLLMDFKILLKTVMIVVFRQNVSVDTDQSETNLKDERSSSGWRG